MARVGVTMLEKTSYFLAHNNRTTDKSKQNSGTHLAFGTVQTNVAQLVQIVDKSNSPIYPTELIKSCDL